MASTAGSNHRKNFVSETGEQTECFVTGHSVLPIPAPLFGEGIPSPNSQFWCGESLPLPNFLKLPLVRGGQPKLVRGARLSLFSTNKQCKQCSTPARTPEAHRDVQRVEQLRDSDCFLTLWRPQPPCLTLLHFRSLCRFQQSQMVWQRLSHLMVPLACACTEP